MHDYVRGALQALSWVMLILIRVKDLESLKKAVDEIDGVLEIIVKAVGVNFREDVEKAIEAVKNGD